MYTQFNVGARPSETTALRLKDIDFVEMTVSISKSRHLGTDGKPKTKASRRTITLPVGVAELIKAIRLPWETPDSHVFYNRFGGPISAGDWAGKY